MKIDNIIKGVKRLFTPSIVVTLYYLFKYGAKVSPRAEVDISKNLQFGKDCVVSSFTKIKANDGPLKMGDRSGIANGCFIASGAGGITIGKNFICGPNVNIVAVNYSYAQKDVHLEDTEKTSKGIKIGDNVWIGSGCTITDGTEIGDNTIIVANSLVNRRYKNDVMLQGNPAKVILKR